VDAWMLVVDDAARPRLLQFHLHVNVLGWITLTVLGTLLTLWPTVLRTRMAEGAVRAATRALPSAAAGLALLGIGLLAWWPVVAAAGGVGYAAVVLITAVPAVVAARQRAPSSFSARSIVAGIGWLLVALAFDTVLLLSAADPAVAHAYFATVLVP